VSQGVDVGSILIQVSFDVVLTEMFAVLFERYQLLLLILIRLKFSRFQS
jgi:hypothetical protein